MKGYIYSMSADADPGKGWVMTDPIFQPKPTLGACMPNIRRLVVPGDYIFVVSGRIPDVRQYVVGGFRVDQIIDALAAYKRFPENRLRESERGGVLGNVIVDENGNHHPKDNHSNFERRVENYIVGGDPIYLDGPAEIQRSREASIPFLSRMFATSGSTAIEVMTRWRKLNENQIDDLLVWMRGIKGRSS